METHTPSQAATQYDTQRHMLAAGFQDSACTGRHASDTHTAASPLTPTSREEALLPPRTPSRPAAALLCSVPLAAPGNRNGAGRDELTLPPARPPRPNSLQMPAAARPGAESRGLPSGAPLQGTALGLQELEGGRAAPEGLGLGAAHPGRGGLSPPPAFS